MFLHCQPSSKVSAGPGRCRKRLPPAVPGGGNGLWSFPGAHWGGQEKPRGHLFQLQEPSGSCTEDGVPHGLWVCLTHMGVLTKEVAQSCETTTVINQHGKHTESHRCKESPKNSELKLKTSTASKHTNERSQGKEDK